MSAIEMSAQSQKISLLPINGTQFTAGKKVIFELTPDLGFMKAARDESYLVFTVRNSGTARWMFATSGQSLIQRVDIFSMATGQQLESLQEYNKMMWILDQYSQVTHGIKQSYEGLRKSVTSLETFANGATAPRLVSSDGTADSVMNSIISPIKTDGTLVPLGWQVCVPLKAGIFACFGEEKLTPLIAMGGLRVELTLEDEALVCVPIQPILADKEFRIVSNQSRPFAVTGGGAPHTTLIIAGTTVVATGLVPGQMVHVVADALAVQAVRITSIVQAGANVNIVVDTASPVAANGKLIPGIAVSNAGELNTFVITDTTVEKCGLQGTDVAGKQQAITISTGAADGVARNIRTLVQAGANVTVTFDGDPIDLSGTGAMACVTESQWESGRGYAIDSLEYRVQQVMGTKQMLDNVSKGLLYSFRSWDLFFDSIPAASRRHQVEIPSVSSMAKCVMSHFSFASKDRDPNMPQYYTGTTPDDLALNSLQYFINNKLFPLRDYDPRVKRDRPQQYNELQKAFSAMGTPARSFGDASGSNLNGYSNTFLATRELARGRFVYSLREAEPSVRLAFAATRDEICRVNSFVWSEKVVRVEGTNISVVL